ncbi:hypothetical protein BD410DRAFT_133439 [Rickenella mellea]|uniref:Peroxin-14 n=1 Tax=Rickenella mellea TaxID=50990 RepID=A0A4Y7QB59_9AGAM|nr:hypothetical protein BD410DRAFT_133439 [Rickenella mellea]
MNPHFHGQGYMPYMHYRRGPRRLFWFFLGGAGVFWFMRHRDGNGRSICSRSDRRIEAGDRPYNYPTPPATPTVPPPVVPPVYKEERDSIHEVTQNITESISEMSEAALDNALSSIAGLKAKIAESRAWREKVKAEQQQQRERESRRLV